MINIRVSDLMMNCGIIIKENRLGFLICVTRGNLSGVQDC